MSFWKGFVTALVVIVLLWIILRAFYMLRYIILGVFAIIILYFLAKHLRII